MSIDQEGILEFLSSEATRPLKVRELAKKMEIPDEEYGTFRRTIREMLRNGLLVKMKRGKIGLPARADLVVGRLVSGRSGYGFVVPEDKSDDVYVRDENMGYSLHGDTVVVRLLGRRRGPAREGSIVKVLKRVKQSLVGTYHKSRFADYVEPDDHKISKGIYVAPEDSKGATDGQKVVVSLSDWEAVDLGPEGKIVEVLGFPDEPGMDILCLIRERELPLSFPSHVEDELVELPDKVGRRELQSRFDLRDKNCFTIDPVDAKDHDDAVSLEIRPDGNYLLGVHIADVSFYVKEDSALDHEALKRGTSVYLVDRVIPMLPEKLSNSICSLKPQRNRLTYSIMLELTPEGDRVGCEIKESVIKSRAKLNYDEVQKFFDTGRASKRMEDLEDDLVEMLKLSRKLLEKRLKRGSLDFDLPEAHVVMGKDGRVQDIFEVARLESHRLIEEFMLLANRTVAEHVTRRAVPFLYRIHEEPDPDKMEAFSDFVSTLGHSFKVSGRVRPKRIQGFLKSLEGTPEEELINEILLRSLKKACYAPEDVGHFGLAFSHYTHFTSPIRRYPDLLVHRLLKEMQQGRYSIERQSKLVRRLPKIGEITSERERLADDAERESIKIKQIEFMQDKLGEEHQGLISSVVSFGFFVRLDSLLAEGLVRVSSLDDDYYIFDEKGKRWVGRRTRRIYKLGDRVRVQVARVAKEQKEIDFVLAGASPPKARRVRGRGKKKPKVRRRSKRS
ncbi:MAG: ribonuclease R [Candidatus Zixiibacteriota bacterium]|nr:MAG: ribonuclease R [candidate division Zixibacteria bacterium]